MPSPLRPANHCRLEVAEHNPDSFCMREEVSKEGKGGGVNLIACEPLEYGGLLDHFQGSMFAAPQIKSVEMWIEGVRPTGQS